MLIVPDLAEQATEHANADGLRYLLALVDKGVCRHGFAELGGKAARAEQRGFG
jgi:hypothetical protein